MKNIFWIFLFVAGLQCVGCNDVEKKRSEIQSGKNLFVLPDEIDLMDYQEGSIKLQGVSNGNKVVLAEVHDFKQGSYGDCQIKFLTGEDSEYNNVAIVLKINSRDITIILPRSDKIK